MPPLKLRVARAEDFDGFYRLFFPAYQQDTQFRATVKREWQVVMNSETSLSLVVEDKQENHQLVGICQLVFVTDEFVSWAKAGMAPWACARATSAMEDGSWPILDSKSLEAANTGDGVNVFLFRWGAANFLSTEEHNAVHEYMSRRSTLFHRGYNYKEMLVEAVGEKARQRAIAGGFYVRNDYARFCLDPLPPPHERPFLLSITREEAKANPGALASQMFVYAPPRFFLKPHQQELLQMALLDMTDEEVAAKLNIELVTVKMRWRSIFSRVSKIDENLLPDSMKTKVRGPEKRGILLRYLMDHLEELRPVNARLLQTKQHISSS